MDSTALQELIAQVRSTAAELARLGEGLRSQLLRTALGNQLGE